MLLFILFMSQKATKLWSWKSDSILKILLKIPSNCLPKTMNFYDFVKTPGFKAIEAKLAALINEEEEIKSWRPKFSRPPRKLKV